MNHYLKFSASILLVIIIITSCSKESNQQKPAEECLTCAYMPACPGYEYVYQTDLFDSSALNIVHVWKEKFISYDKDTIINGLPCKKIRKSQLWMTPGTVDTSEYKYSQYYYCDNNISIWFGRKGMDTINFFPLMTIRADEPIGSTWIDSFTLSNNTRVEETYTMKAKNTSHIAYGATYNEVIAVHYVEKYNEEIVYTGDYYFAKNIGLIEDAFVNGDGAENKAHTELRSFIRP